MLAMCLQSLAREHRAVSSKDAVSERDPRLAAVAKVARALSAPMSLADLLHEVLAAVRQAVDADRATLYLVDEHEECLTSIVSGGPIRQIRLHYGQGIAGWVAQTRRTVNVKDAYQDPRFDASWDLENGYRTRSMLCQPVLDREDNLVAVAQVLNKHGGWFGVADEELLATILSMAAISIVNARLAEKLAANNKELVAARHDLANRVREIDMLYDLEREAARSATLDEAVRGVMERIMSTLDADLLEVAVRCEAGGLVVYRSSGPECFDVLQLPSAKGLMGKIFSSPQRYNPCELGREELSELAREEQLPWVPAAGLCVPLERDDSLVGAMAVYWRPGGTASLTEPQERVVELSADQVGHALGQRMARQQLDRQDRLAAIGSALSAVLHDLKTPVTVASGYVQLLKLEDDPAERAQLADLVLSQLAKMTEMTREVLSFARGDRDLLLRKVMIPEMAGELRTALASVFDGADIHWEVRCEDRGIGRIDSNKVLRALVNLARNARDAFDAQAGQATGSAPRLPSETEPSAVPAAPSAPKQFTLTLASQGDQLVLTAEDNGPGVPREFQHRLFEAFASHGKKDGTGIGLAMVRRVAMAHGGDVGYRETPGGGATFEMRLARDNPGRRNSERILNQDLSLPAEPPLLPH